ncbi:MAG: HAD family hydrolase [Planctomycetota bacterium]|jgi:HAD superfamily hydrolase (TIGR01509 family)
MKYKYILFDNDGVLIDTEKWYYEATRKVLTEFDIEFTREQYLLLQPEGRNGWDLARDKGISEEVINEKRKLRNKYYQQYICNEDIDIDGVIPTLEKLAEKYQMGIVTTALGVDFKLIHDKRKITEWMDFCLVREDYERSKPYPDPYLAGLAKFAAAPEEAIVIEDSSRGLKATQAAGIECVIVKNEFTESQDFSGAKAVLERFEDIPEYLNDIPK